MMWLAFGIALLVGALVLGVLLLGLAFKDR